MNLTSGLNFVVATLLAALSSAFVVPSSKRRCPSGGTSSTHLEASSPPVQAQEGSFWSRSETTPKTTPEIVYILLYNAGTTEEAVYTSDLENGQAEVLWAFEDIEDCSALASLLVQHEPPPSFNMALGAEPIPTPVPLSQMISASQDMGVQLRLVPSP